MDDPHSLSTRFYTFLPIVGKKKESGFFFLCEIFCLDLRGRCVHATAYLGEIMYFYILKRILINNIVRIILGNSIAYPRVKITQTILRLNLNDLILPTIVIGFLVFCLTMS